MTLVAAGCLLLLFFRVLFDPACRSGINAANKELQGNQPFRLRWTGPFNRDWGLFGSRMGDRPLQIVRAILLVEFILALVLTSHDRPDLLLLSATSFAIAIILTILHVGLNAQPQQF